MTDWEKVTPLPDGRRVVTTASRHEVAGTGALVPAVTPVVYRGHTCLGEHPVAWYGAWPPLAPWLDLVHASEVALALGTDPRDIQVATLDVPGHGRRYVAVEARRGELDVLTAPCETREAVATHVALLRDLYRGATRRGA